jgi:cytochrome c-type biogenesis protein CcmE
MDPRRKRRIRLVVALSAAVLLAGALVYVSFSGATEEATPAKVLAAGDGGGNFKLGGKVVDGSVERGPGDRLSFDVREPKGGDAKVHVVYQGVVPDPFREGREVSVEGEMRDGRFVGERDSLVTKCPSKFQNADSGRSL